jgi:hypothetical protein
MQVQTGEASPVHSVPKIKHFLTPHQRLFDLVISDYGTIYDIYDI